VTTSHEALLTAAHVQSAGALTLNVPLAASLPNSAESGDSSYEQTVGVLPGWVTVWLWPAIVIAPVLASVDALALTVYVTDPVPVNVVPGTLIQAELELAVHVQLAVVVTLTAPWPPSGPNDWLAGVTVKLQTGAGPLDDFPLQFASPRHSRPAMRALASGRVFIEVLPGE
jgi:hypothetical protein